MANLDNEFDQEIDLDAAFDEESELTPEQAAQMESVSQSIAGFEEETAALVPEATVPPQPMTASEAFITHAVPSATLGLSDIASGVKAGGEQFVRDIGKEGPSIESTLKAYKEGKEFQRTKRETALEEQTAASIGGMVTGGLATPIPGAAIGKMGLTGAKIAKVLPSLKGATKIARGGRFAAKAKRAGNLELYVQLKRARDTRAIALAAREGAKAGTISGITQGSAELLAEGDIKGTIKDAVVGGALGSAAGAGMVGGSQATGKILMAVPALRNSVDSFSLGLKGISLNSDEVAGKIGNAARRYIGEFQKRLSKLSGNKEKIVKMIEDAGITINSREELEQARKLVASISSPTERKRAQQFLDILDDYLDGGKAMKAAKARLEKDLVKANLKDPLAEAQAKLEKRALKKAIQSNKVSTAEVETGVIDAEDVLPDGTPGTEAAFRQQGKSTTAEVISQPRMSGIKRSVDPDTGREVLSVEDLASGKVKSIVGDVPADIDVENLTYAKTEELQKLLKRYSVLIGNDALPDKAQEAATKASVLINKKLAGAGDDIGQPLKEVNEQITSLLNAKQFSGLKDKAYTVYDKGKNEQILAEFISGVADKKTISNKSLMMKQLRKVDPKLAKEIDIEITELRRLHQLSDPADHVPESASFRSLMGSASGVVNKISNALGRGASLPGRVVSKQTAGIQANLAGKLTGTKAKLADKVLDIIESSPDQVKSIITRLSGSPSKSTRAFLPALEKAADATPRSRIAIMNGLMQQPAFRELLEETQGFVEEEE